MTPEGEKGVPRLGKSWTSRPPERIGSRCWNAFLRNRGFAGVESGNLPPFLEPVTRLESDNYGAFGLLSRGTGQRPLEEE